MRYKRYGRSNPYGRTGVVAPPEEKKLSLADPAAYVSAWKAEGGYFDLIDIYRHLATISVHGHAQHNVACYAAASAEEHYNSIYMG